VTPKVRVESFSISLDGFGAGPDQGPDSPNGIGGLAVHGWAFGTRTFHAMFGRAGGATGPDDDFVARGFRNIGAWLMGRNMFGPVRGPWPDEPWKGWWGDNPPFHCSVFVLTHHPRASIEMQGGTVFHFATDGLPAALRRALATAEGRDVRLGGGVATVQEGLRASLIHPGEQSLPAPKKNRRDHARSLGDMSGRLRKLIVRGFRSELASTPSGAHDPGAHRVDRSRPCGHNDHMVTCESEGTP